MSLCEFELKVLDNLMSFNLSPDSFTGDDCIGAAVSGGADSISLLLALSRIFNPSQIKVINVNHNIRSEEESGADSDYVKDFCSKNGIFCKVVELERGLVLKYAETHCNGTEDAARFLRYKVFETFISDYKLKCLCLAHNKNDQLETLLMRFLQGSGIESSTGIRMKRDSFIRPLLTVSRAEIEAYLADNDTSYKIDSTNADNHYLRNKIRNVLVPSLNEMFPGWQSAVLNGREKNIDDNEELEKTASQIKTEIKKDGVYIDKKSFYSCSDGIKRRVIYRAVNSAGFSERLGYNVVRQVSSWSSKSGMKVRYGDIQITSDDKNVIIKKYTPQKNEGGFTGILKENNEVYLDNGKITVKLSDNIVTVQNDFLFLRLKGELPVIIRSVQRGDLIKTKAGAYREVSEVFSDWHVSPEVRNKIPVVQYGAGTKCKIAALLGEFYGYKNWILSDYKL